MIFLNTNQEEESMFYLKSSPRIMPNFSEMILRVYYLFKTQIEEEK